MCKRCITPSYVLLFAQRWNPLETHVFVFSLYNIAFKKLSLQGSNQRFIRLVSYFAYSASGENGTSFNFLLLLVLT